MRTAIHVRLAASRVMDRFRNACSLHVHTGSTRNSIKGASEIGQGKGKVHPKTGHESPEGEWRYSSTHSLA